MRALIGSLDCLNLVELLFTKRREPKGPSCSMHSCKSCEVKFRFDRKRLPQKILLVLGCFQILYTPKIAFVWFDTQFIGILKP